MNGHGESHLGTGHRRQEMTSIVGNNLSVTFVGIRSLWWRWKEKYLERKGGENEVSAGLAVEAWERRRWTIRRLKELGG